MNNVQIINQDYDVLGFDETNLIGPPLRFKEINEQLHNQTGGGYRVSKPTLRSYHNIGLVKRPEKQGREAFYPWETVFSLLAIRQLRIFYEYSTKDILHLMNCKHHIFKITMALEKLEGKLLYQAGSPGLSEFFSEIRSKHRGNQDLQTPVNIKMTLGEVHNLQTEWGNFALHVLRAKGGSLIELRREYENAILGKGWDPSNVDLDFE